MSLAQPYPLFPHPKSLHFKDETLKVSSLRLVAAEAIVGAAALTLIQEELTDAFALTLDEGAAVTLYLSGNDSLPSPEGYRLEILPDAILLRASSDAGFLYAIATLRQLGKVESDGVVHFPCCEIEDYPDIPHRYASRWLIELEGARMAYDWGDGREKMLERYRGKIDFCLRHKINRVFFEGFEWKTDKYPEYVDDIRALNAYARVRKVKLEFGGHVIGFGGYVGHTMHGAAGLGGYNRRSYPEGEIYACGRVDGPFDPFFPSITSDAMFNGTCCSNDALNQLKKDQLADYVRQIEPSVLYLHSEDIAIYEELRRMWLHRCDACRERWPSDAIAVANGAAGGIAHRFRWLKEAVACVKNRDSGYDGARDCELIFVSPSYSAYYDTDEEWKKVADFWVAVSSLLEPDENLLFGIREQFWQKGEPVLRIGQLAERLQREGNGHGLFVFSVGGADLYNNSALFSSAPRLNHFFAGAKAIFNFNGGLFAPAQEIYNAEYTWNLRSPWGIDEAADDPAAAKIYLERSVEMRHPEPEALLRAITRHLYGEAAGAEMEAFYLLQGEERQFPLAIAFRLCRQLLGRKEPDAAQERRRWSAAREATLRGLECVRKALACPGIEAMLYEELQYLCASLEFGERLAEIVADGFAPDARGEEIAERFEALEAWVVARYPQDFTSRYEGEANLWRGYLCDLRGLLSKRLKAQPQCATAR